MVDYSIIQNSPLHLAVYENNKELVKYFLNNNIDPNITITLGFTALHIVKHKKIAKLLIKHGGNVNQLNQLGYPPIYYARTKTLIKVFIQNNANIHFIDGYGNTLLHNHSIHNTTKGIIKLLINNGLHINSINYNGDTPLHYVQNIEIAYGLLSKSGGCVLTLQNNNGETPLHNILKLYNNDIISLIILLLEYQDIINIQDSNGNTPLHVFCNTIHYQWTSNPNIDKNIAFTIIGILLKNNANTVLTNNQNMTPFDVILQESGTQNLCHNVFDCLIQEIYKYIQEQNNLPDYINIFNKLYI